MSCFETRYCSRGNSFIILPRSLKSPSSTYLNFIREGSEQPFSF
nr:MAG TPA: hypothetical protein [Caudoviricetes sp.]